MTIGPREVVETVDMKTNPHLQLSKTASQLALVQTVNHLLEMGHLKRRLISPHQGLQVQIYLYHKVLKT